MHVRPLYLVVPRHHVQHVQKMGPNIFVHNENIAHVMPCGIECAMTSRAQPPYVYVVHQELLMDVLFMRAKQYLSKLTASHFGTLNTRFANQNVMERILIAMHDENKADCNENFRIWTEELIAPLYSW